MAAVRLRPNLVLILAWFLLALELMMPNMYARNMPQARRNKHIVDLERLADLPRDSSGQYAVQQFAYAAKIRSSEDAARREGKLPSDATLATHLTPDHLPEAVETFSRWGGHGSAAVFITNSYDYALACSILDFLLRCYAESISAVAFHFVFLSNASRYQQHAQEAPHVAASLSNYFTALSCSTSLEQVRPPTLAALLGDAGHAVVASHSQSPRATAHDTGNYAHDIPYPNNMLRNVAMEAATSEAVLVLDADMLPSHNLAAHAAALIDRTDFEDRVVFVIPAFEMKQGASVPTDKEELLRALATGDAQSFYHDVCAKCQNTTDFAQWLSIAPDTAADPDSGYDVMWRDPWEPFYLSRRTYLPRYDERFMQYGFNRISQACELHVAGYRFHVLAQHFVVHKGFKVATFHPSKEKEQQANRMLFRAFKQELKEKYPGVRRRCY